MIIKNVLKAFTLEPRANSVECGVIAAIVGTALFSAMLALSQPVPVAHEVVTSRVAAASHN
jgi:Flp pilus assembly pilin Flp